MSAHPPYVSPAVKVGKAAVAVTEKFVEEERALQLVHVVGPRQSGKHTLVKRLVKEGVVFLGDSTTYHSLYREVFGAEDVRPGGKFRKMFLGAGKILKQAARAAAAAGLVNESVVAVIGHLAWAIPKLVEYVRNGEVDLLVSMALLSHALAKHERYRLRYFPRTTQTITTEGLLRFPPEKGVVRGEMAMAGHMAWLMGKDTPLLVKMSAFERYCAWDPETASFGAVFVPQLMNKLLWPEGVPPTRNPKALMVANHLAHDIKNKTITPIAKDEPGTEDVED